MQRSFNVPFGDCGSLCAGSTFAERDVFASMNTEELPWVSVPNMVDVYVNAAGLVKRRNSQTGHWTINAGSIDPRGYRKIYANGTGVKGHRLVATAFHPNPNNLPQVNHINGIKHDNRPENLEWCSNLDNMRHAVATGLNSFAKNGEVNGACKLTEDQVRHIYREVKINGRTQISLAREFGVSGNTVCWIISGRIWGHLQLNKESKYATQKQTLDWV